MDTYTITFTKEEAIALRFLLGGAAQYPNVTPPQRLAAQDALGKVNAALFPPVEPENKSGFPLEIPPA